MASAAKIKFPILEVGKNAKVIKYLSSEDLEVLLSSVFTPSAGGVSEISISQVSIILSHQKSRLV